MDGDLVHLYIWSSRYALAPFCDELVGGSTNHPLALLDRFFSLRVWTNLVASAKHPKMAMCVDELSQSVHP